MENTKLKELNRDPNGIWEVSTESREMGFGTVKLGVYSGRFDEIAFALAEKATHSLIFERLDTTIPTPKDLSSSVRVATKELRQFRNRDRVSFFEDMLKGTGVRAIREVEANACLTVLLERDIPEEMVRERALAKLTEAEKKVLGLI